MSCNVHFMYPASLLSQWLQAVVDYLKQYDQGSKGALTREELQEAIRGRNFGVLGSVLWSVLWSVLQFLLEAATQFLGSHVKLQCSSDRTLIPAPGSGLSVEIQVACSWRLTG